MLDNELINIFVKQQEGIVGNVAEGWNHGIAVGVDC